MTSHGSRYRHLLHNGQVKYHIGIVTMAVLSIVNLSIQAIAPQRPKACLLSGGLIRNDLCQCGPSGVNCGRVPFPMSQVPIAVPPAINSFILKNNMIERLEEDDFLGLENLLILSLEDNSLSYIHPNALRNLYKLKHLLLDNNKLTHLDPSGRTFQHLYSLQKLFLRGNQIMKINKYSFLTSFNLTVSLDGNPVKCDCDVLALRSWENLLSNQVVKIEGLTCANDMGRPYKDVPDYMFGTCTATDEVFSRPIECPVCQNERTNHGCRLQGSKECIGEKMMCHKAVNWNAKARLMSISSNCSSHEPCLREESNNKNYCGIGYLNFEDVRCNFCCRKSTCANNYMEGRTKDFTFTLSYFRSSAEFFYYFNDRGDWRFTQEESRIEKGIQFIMANLSGGMDVYVTQFIKEHINGMRVVLRLEVTTLNTETREKVLKTMTENLRKDESSFLKQENIMPQTVKLAYKPEVSGICPQNVSSSEEKGDIYWKMSPVGSHSSMCPYQDYPDQQLSMAHRTCLQKEDGSLGWSDVDYSSCTSKKKLTNGTLESILDIPISLENAQVVSNLLRGFTKNLDNATLDNLNNIVHLLEQFTSEAMLEVPSVVTNVVSSLSNLMNVDEETLREVELKSPISERLLEIVDFISEKGPLVGGQLVEVTPNLVIVAQQVNATMRQDVVLNANAGSDGRFSVPMVSIGFINGNVPQPKGRSSMVIPIATVVDSLNSAEKFNTRDNITRVSCAVHQSDKLFITAKHKKSVEASQVKIAQNSDCKTNESSSCQKQNASLPVTKINSHVIAARVPGVEVHNLTKNITMRFVHTETNAKNPRCVFWNQSLSNGQGDWSDEGCVYIESNASETTCSCNHLTNFALLMDVYQGSGGVSELDKKILSIISYVGCGISLVALILTLLTYTVFRKLRRDNPSKILINLCLALLLSNLIFLVGMHDYTFDNTVSCKVIAILMHYFLLASLTWMAVEAFYMYLALILVFKTYFTHFILKCCLIGWGVPLVVVIITLSIDATENYGFIASGLCWLRNPAFFAAFVGPVCLILLINCIAFGLVIRTLVGVSSHKLNKTDKNNTSQRLRGAVGVVVLLGLTWLFAIFAIDQANVVFYYFFAVLNSLQGLFIFIFYCLLKKDAILLWKRSLPCFEEYGESSKSASNSRAVTAKAGSHHLVNKHDNRSKSDSSTFLTNTVSLIDSRKDSCFNDMNTNHNDESSEECDTNINSETLAVSEDKEKLSPLLQRHKQQDSPVSDKLPSYTTLEYGNSSNDFDSLIENTHKDRTTNDNLPKGHKSSSSESQLAMNESSPILSKGLKVPDQAETNKKLEAQKEKDSQSVREIIQKFEPSNSDKEKLSVTHL